jgi:nitrogen fixation/metabolism regulation signal transduction histidine kinase
MFNVERSGPRHKLTIISVLSIGAALMLAFLVFAATSRSIADPIAKLINAAQKVAASQNYTLRIAPAQTTNWAP